MSPYISCFECANLCEFVLSGIEKPAIVTKMNLTLSADHRVFDGKVGGM